MPSFGPCLTTKYLREVFEKSEEDCSVLKVTRDQTHPIPKGTKRNFNSVDTLTLLIKTLKDKGKKPCGFNYYSEPNLD